MTEAEWLSLTDAFSLLHFVIRFQRPSHRKLRLYGCGCCRLVWPLLCDERSRLTVEVAEAFADGKQSSKMPGKVPRWPTVTAICEWEKSCRQGRTQPTGTLRTLPPTQPGRSLGSFRSAQPTVARKGSREPLTVGTDRLNPQQTARRLAWPTSSGTSSATLSGQLPSTTAALPQWSPPLAQAIYEERQLPSGQLDPTRLAVLADALAEAGCADPTILDHLRGPDSHVRGCWPVDLVLAKD